ncbi:hypothetical protein BDN72DRAFT_903191 [Pluteus cervinus]|uniref:Uncharacterized protein n=1 Tax=Pluteus cervinus TaxID=181527 RepID=A0ACD3AA55_9AGAR|nr:hypothetical protein BDN72DRAFT_903191 [Pluteus cervinus]
MAHNLDLIRRLCRQEETVEEAQSIYRIAQVKTGPGSGYDLGPHTTGLPAICAYIASKRLKNTDVTRQSAQQASCLKAADFEKAFYTVEAAIGGARKRGPVELTYEGLIEKYSIPMAAERLVPWMQRAELALMQVDKKYETLGPEMKGTVFLWVCSAIRGKKIVPFQNFAEDNRIPVRAIRSIYDAVTTVCAPLKAQLLEAMKPKPRESPSKAAHLSSDADSVPVSPTKRSPSKKTAIRALPMGGTPQKRKVAFSESEETSRPASEEITTDDMSMDVDRELAPQTPTHNRVMASPSKSQLKRTAIFSSQTIPTPSSSRMQLDTMTPKRSLAKKPLERLEHYLVSPSKASPATPRRRGKPLIPESDGNEADINTSDVDAMEVDEVATAWKDRKQQKQKPRQRFRPVYLDYKQWNALDPRVEVMMKTGASPVTVG